MSKILSFDTSNYTTSVCLFDTHAGVVWDKRLPVSVADGKCGVRQSDAVFHHVKNLNLLLDENCCTVPDAVCASDRPSERDNSYMPCFLVGTAFAKVTSALFGCPTYFNSHQKNHIAAAAYSGGRFDILKSRFIAYHVSGGTTDIVLCTPRSGGFNAERIGGTADISCGQLIDRVGVLLGYPFPCGKSVEKNAIGNIGGKIRIASHGFEYNFSGFQNIIEKMKYESTDAAQICDYTLDVVYSFLSDSIHRLRQEYGKIPVLLSGGVMSNKIISDTLCDSFDDICFSAPMYSVDNSLGSACLCAYARGELNV